MRFFGNAVITNRNADVFSKAVNDAAEELCRDRNGPVRLDIRYSTQLDEGGMVYSAMILAYEEGK